MHPRINKTTDNGTEFACHEMIAKSIGTKVYSKNTCFSNISQQQITKIMQKINTRPRENSISQLLMSAFTKKCCKFALAS